MAEFVSSRRGLGGPQSKQHLPIGMDFCWGGLGAGAIWMSTRCAGGVGWLTNGFLADPPAAATTMAEADEDEADDPDMAG